LGVDIEEIKQIDMKIAERFFSPQEYRDLMEQQVSQQLEYFFKLWSLKESYIKAEGKGLSIPLDSFSFSFDNEEISLSLHREVDYNNYCFRMYNVDPSYKMALCTTDIGAIPKEAKNIGLQQLYVEATRLLNGSKR